MQSIMLISVDHYIRFFFFFSAPIREQKRCNIDPAIIRIQVLIFNCTVSAKAIEHLAVFHCPLYF